MSGKPNQKSQTDRSLTPDGRRVFTITRTEIHQISDLDELRQVRTQMQSRRDLLLKQIGDLRDQYQVVQDELSQVNDMIEQEERTTIP